MNFMSFEDCPAIQKILRRYVPPLIAFSLFCVFAFWAATCFISCIDVLNYTIPAIQPENAAEFSMAGYWQETELLSHFMGMPSSAQRYFVLHGAASGVCMVLAVIAAVDGGRMVFKREVLKVPRRHE